MEVHRVLGPGLLESAYQRALAYELRLRGFDVKTEVPVYFNYKEAELCEAYRADIIVNDEILLELKSVQEIKPVFKAQLLTYLKLSKYKIGYLINFNTISLRNNDSYFRYVNNL